MPASRSAVDGLDVVPVPVGGEHAADARGPADLEQELVLVGGVDDDGLAGALAAHDEHVVLDRPDDELVDADGRGLVVRGTRHALQGTRRAGARPVVAARTRVR